MTQFLAHLDPVNVREHIYLEVRSVKKQLPQRGRFGFPIRMTNGRLREVLSGDIIGHIGTYQGTQRNTLHCIAFKRQRG